MNPKMALWETGDFTRLAHSMRGSGEALVGRTDYGPTMKAFEAAAKAGREADL